MFPPQTHTFHSVPRIQMFPSSSTLLLKRSRRPGDAARLPSTATVNAPRHNAGHLHVVETGDKTRSLAMEKVKAKSCVRQLLGSPGGRQRGHKALC